MECWEVIKDAIFEFKDVVEELIDAKGETEHIGDVISNFQKVFAKKTGKTLSDLDDDVDRLNDQVEELRNRITNKLLLVEILIKKLPLTTKMYKLKYIVNKQVEQVLRMNQLYSWYSNETMTFSDETFLRFSQKVTGAEADSVASLLDSIYTNIADQRMDEGNLLTYILQHSQTEKDTLCNTGTSSQFPIFHLYTFVIMLEHMGLQMALFVLKFTKNSEGGMYDTEILKDYMTSLAYRIGNYTDKFNEALKTASRDIRRCDPQRHMRDVTFYEFDGLVQGTVMWERMDVFSCARNCESMSYDSCTKDDGSCNSIILFENLPCVGRIDTCSKLSQDVNICINSEGFRKSTRRYRWITTTDSGNWGKSNSFGRCDNTDLFENGAVFRANALKSGYMEGWCDFCKCTCHQKSREGENYGVSISWAMSNFKANMVIIFMRFRKERRNVIYIQIKEGKLLPNGAIEAPAKEIVSPRFGYCNETLHEFNET